jgi:hypothetical protein
LHDREVRNLERKLRKKDLPISNIICRYLPKKLLSKN